MANNVEQTLDKLMGIDGAIAASIIDTSSGFMLGSRGESFDLEYASAGFTELLNAHEKIVSNLKMGDEVVDFMISYSNMYHLLCPVKQIKGVLVFLVVNRQKVTLALAQRVLKTAAGDLRLS